MLFTKQNPTGVDIPIQRFQKYLYEALKGVWPVSDSDFEGYGRCYRNQTTEGYIPEVWVGSGTTRYKEVFFDDTLLKALFFFHVKEDVRYNAGSALAKVSLIFIVNIPLVKPLVPHRGDEEVRIDVQRQWLGRFGVMTGFKTGIKNVFNEFDAWLSKDQVTYRDLHPLHVFSIEFDLLYNINDC